MVDPGRVKVRGATEETYYLNERQLALLATDEFCHL